MFNFNAAAQPYFYFVADLTPIVPQHIWSTLNQSKLSTYQKVAQKAPKDPTAQLAIAYAASDIGSTKVQIAAYRRFLMLAPDDANAPLVRRQLKQLTKTAKTQSG